MITLQFLRGNGLDSQLIEWYGGGPMFSHVDSVLPAGEGLLGSRSDGGVQIRNPNYTLDLPTLVVQLACGDVMTAAFYAYMRSQIGKPYDHTGILAFVVGRDWQSPDSWFCSELVAAALEQCGYFPFPLAAPSNKVTPPALLLVLSSTTRIEL